MNLGEFDAAAAARDELGGLAASGRVFKGLESDGEGSACADRARFGCGSARVLAGLEVGERPDQWVPPGSDSGTRGPLVGGRIEGAAGAGGGSWAAAPALAGPRKKKEGGRSGPSGRIPGRGRRKINLSFYLFIYSKPLSNLI